MKYTPRPEDVEKVISIFTYHPQRNEEQGDRYHQIRERFLDLGLSLLELCPPGRELAMAISELQLAQHLAIGAIAIGESKDSPIKLTGIDK